MSDKNSISKDSGSKEDGFPKDIPPHLELINISDCFLSDLECIREMVSYFAPMLQQQDKERKEAVEKIMLKIESSAKKKDETPPSDKSNDNIEVSISVSDVEELISNIRKMNRAGQLFRQQSTVSLISRFDEFIGQFLAIVLRLHPEWLNSSDKTITYKELVRLESIEKAVIGLIQKEVENILRGSHEEQLKFIDEKLKLGIYDSFNRLVDFLEVTERRNLFVHTGGKVSQQYLDRCRAFGLENDRSSCVGDFLDIDSNYFNDAFSLCFELGLRISQAAIRRLFPDELLVADRALNHLAIKFLNSNDYSLAEVICEFDLGIPDKLRSDDTEFLYFARINRAIAQKFVQKEFKKGLQGIHWQAFHPKYQFALDVLNDEYEKAGDFMKSQVIQESVGKTGFRTWPLFKEFRNTEIFRKMYFEIYEEEYFPDPEKDMEGQSIADGLMQAQIANKANSADAKNRTAD